MKYRTSLLAAGFAAVLAGCTTGNTAVPPPATAVNPITSNKLQFAVGTANIAGTAGLNTVVTYRQPNGLDGTLLNTPTIVGPAGFVNTGATAPSIDAGTNTIAGSAQPLLGTPAAPSTFGTSGGAFAYGFQPNNSTTTGGVSFARYALPFYGAAATQLTYIGGPPAYPNVRNGTFPSGFQGYPLGFTDFRLTPVVGTYTLNLAVPTGFDGNGNPTSQTVSAAATLASAALLPAIPTPAFVPDGAGGGTATVTIPAGVTEALVIVRNGTGTCYPGAQSAPAYFTFRTTTAGTQSFTLAPNLGPTGPGAPSTKTLCTGDAYRVYAVGFDYPAFAAGPPNSASQTPAITGANGQADITTSGSFSGTAP